MYVVVQEIQYKEPSRSFTQKEIEIYTATDYQGYEYYGYRSAGGLFERDITTAYKVSIHESYRENGVVKKRQWHVTTAGFYSVAEYSFYDCISSHRIKKLMEVTGLSEKGVWDLLYTKLDRIEEAAKERFSQTEEYKTSIRQEALKAEYVNRKQAFEDIYGQYTYDRCYDFFDNLRNLEYLEQLQAEKKARDEYTKRSYQQSYERTYNEYKSSYSQTSTSNYDDNEKKMLKKLYRTMSKTFHPDVTGDDGEMMKLLTKLKEEWGV
jgi:hypothetical protein